MIKNNKILNQLNYKLNYKNNKICIHMYVYRRIRAGNRGCLNLLCLFKLKQLWKRDI